MNDIMNNSTQTPIEIALGIDENGMTTARALYDFLGMDKSNYSRWVKNNVTDNRFAEENVDFVRFVFNDETPTGGVLEREDFKLTSHFAKKLSMMQKNERGEEAREYFARLEENTKEMVINRSQLSPQMQMLMGMVETQARQELEQKRLAEQINRIENNQKAIADTFHNTNDEEDFRSWCKRCISKIVNIGNFKKGSEKSELFRNAWNESFDRLNQKRPCNLKQRVINAKGIALETGKTKTWIDQNINNLAVISGDKDLRPAYESVMREMMIAYCVESE